MCKLITLDDGSLVTEDFINPSKIPEDIERFNKIKSMYKVGELKKILKNAGIKGYSKLKEDQLVQLIIDNNLD